MLELQPLDPSQYRQVAEWEEQKPLGANVDWGRYAAEMEQPQWSHFGVYDKGEFVGAVSLEKISYNMAAYHVVTARRRVHPQALADLLIQMAGFLFRQGFTAVVARNPADKRAGARLAIRCGMHEWGHTPTTRYFMITQQRFIQNGWFQA